MIYIKQIQYEYLFFQNNLKSHKAHTTNNTNKTRFNQTQAKPKNDTSTQQTQRH